MSVLDKSIPILGAHVEENGVVFSVWAPFASSVAVTGSFNEWGEQVLEKLEGGIWSGRIENAEPGQEYKFVITNGDKKVQKNDPRALQLTTSGDNSLIVDPDFDWQGDAYELPDVNKRVVYELHIGTFNRHDPATPGTFETATEKLDYLSDLGINVIELMPVTSTTADRWWGYDPDYLFAVEAAYGGRWAFMEFVKQAHKRGIGVVLDVVYNHMSPYPGMDLWQFDGWSQDGKGGIYFYNDWRGDTPWGPRLDYGRGEVRDYIVDNAMMWLRDCHVDGLRLDAVFQIRNALGRNDDPGSDLPDGWKLVQEINKQAKKVKSSSMIVAEDMDLNEWITKSIDEKGAGFDAQWGTSIPSTLRGAIIPVDDKDRRLEPLKQAIEKKYNGKAFQRVIYSESHDADANGHARTNEEIAPGDSGNLPARRRSTLAAGIVLTMPGIPMLFQGQEFMEDGWFNHWKGLDWDKIKEFPGVVQLYKDLIKLRKNVDGKTGGLTGDSVEILHLHEGDKVIAYRRFGSDDDVVVAANLSHEQKLNYSVKFPVDGEWKVRFNSDWNGYSHDFTNTETPDVKVEQKIGTVNLGPYSLVILSRD